jgi:peptidoglycan-associated lipoprotein
VLQLLTAYILLYHNFASKGAWRMKKTTLVHLLLITVVLSVTGCAQNAVVNKDDGVVQAVPQNNAAQRKDAPSPSTTATVATSGSDEKIIQPASAVASSDSQQNASAQKSALAAVYFGFDSNILTNESRNTLQANYNLLGSKPVIQIEGHCDERGSSEYNLALGEQRAKAAQNYLVTLGYPVEKLATISYGKERPADQGHDDAAWAKNRRDEFRIVK